MAEMDWARTVPRQAEEAAALSRLPKIIDWESAITVVLMLGAVTAVTVPLEDGGWRRDMPPLTVVAVLAVLFSAVLSRTRLNAVLAWPLSVVAGAAVVAWQTMVMVGPGTVEQRIDAVYYRFGAWFDVAFSDQVTNDALPFNVLILSLTWLSVFMFGWSVTRWHNAWLGLAPGGAALFLDLVLVGDKLTGSIVLYMLFGFLLVMQTNLLANLERWRAEGVQYPSLLNVTFLHFSAWALIGLMTFAWLAPSGPFSTPAPVQTAIDGVLRVGTDFVRLAGPLHSNKVIPIHSYSGVLPFQGSITLGDRELMAVTITDPTIQGPLLLRGTVYDQYEGGGWTTGERQQLAFPPGVEEAVREGVADGELDGQVVPLRIEMTAKSVVGTVVFTPGETISTSRNVWAQIPAGSVDREYIDLPLGGLSMTDTEILEFLKSQGINGLRVVRDPQFDHVQYVETAPLNDYGALEDAVLLDPGARIKRHQSYFVTGFVPNTTPEELRQVGWNYPRWVQAQYLQLPEDFSPAVRALAVDIVRSSGNPYDQAKAIEAYLRQLPVDTRIGDVPAGQDAVEWFLFDERRGYFDYHASAMVVMLRSQGIPARLAVGFVADAGEQNDTGAYVVRDEDSYAWPEVYFEGYGWVAFNPTPDRPEVIVPTERPESEALSGSERDDLFDFLPVSGADQAFFPEDGGGISSGGPGSSIFGEGEAGYTPWALIVALSFGGLVSGAVFMGWQRSVAGIPYPQQVWEKTVRLASWGGMPPQPGQTPHDFAKSLARRFRGVDGWSGLADAYTRSRFGRKETGAEEAEELREMWPDARGAMVRGIFGRVLRRRRETI